MLSSPIFLQDNYFCLEITIMKYFDDINLLSDCKKIVKNIVIHPNV